MIVYGVLWMLAAETGHNIAAWMCLCCFVLKALEAADALVKLFHELKKLMPKKENDNER